MLINAMTSLTRSDVAIVVPGDGDRSLLDEVKRLAIETPGKIAVYPDTSPAAERQILAGADAILSADVDNHLARTAGLAMRYGTLPLVPDSAAYHDYMVDFDVKSRTGTALLFQPDDTYEQVSIALRAAALRVHPDLWHDLQESLMRSAPPWATTAALFETLCGSPPVSA
jgi:glycogen synthase